MATTLTVGDRHTQASFATIRGWQIIKASLSARPQGYKFMRAYKSGHWDGYVCLLEKSTFPSGLLKHVVTALKNEGLEHTVVDNRDSTALPIPNFDGIPGYTFRDYQKEAVIAALTHRRGVLKMATNAGKTLVMAGILNSLPGHQALVIVPTRALLIQTADTLEKMLQRKVGRVGANFQDVEYVTVTTIASLHTIVGTAAVANNQVLIADEVHHARSKTMMNGMMNCPGSYRIGMSGTPLRYNMLDDMKLVGATGDIIYDVTNAQLIQQGYSVPPIVTFYTVAGGNDGLKYQKAYREYIVCNVERNRMIVDTVAQEMKRGPVMVLTNWIEHVNEIYKLMPEGVAKIITGNNSSEDMRNTLEMMRQRQLSVLIATEVFGEGVDVPSVSTVILAAGGKSHIRLLQRIGRGMRTLDGKDELHVYDFIDDTHKHLLKHSQRRHDVYRKEGFCTRLAELTSISPSVPRDDIPSVQDTYPSIEESIPQV